MRSLVPLLLSFAMTAPLSAAAPPPAPGTPGTAPRTPVAPVAPAPSALRDVPVPVTRFEVQGLGEEPRQRLRGTIKEGDAATLNVMVEGMVTSSIDGAGRERERPLPVRWTLDLRASSVAASGVATVEATVRSAEPQRHPLHPAEQVDATTAAVAPLRGQRLELELSADGGLTAARVPEIAFTEERLSTPVSRLVEALSMVLRPVPSDPVGKDARWQVRVDRQVEGADRIEVTTWVVKSVVDGTGAEPDGAAKPAAGAVPLEGVTASVTVHVRAAKPRQPLADGRLAECRFVVLEQLTGSGMGSVRWSGSGFIPENQREQVLVTLFAEGLEKETEERRRLHEQSLISIQVGDRRARP